MTSPASSVDKASEHQSKNSYNHNISNTDFTERHRRLLHGRFSTCQDAAKKALCSAESWT
jgi:hypothetical protein